MMRALPEHASENRRYWNDMAHEWVDAGERAWASAPSWGQWGVPDADLKLLPEDMTGLDAIELGCGTGYISGWMAMRGARVIAIDISEEQLATARRLDEAYGTAVEFIHGSAEDVPLPDGSFDFAVSEYGAAIWCDPYVWLPEAKRLLRPGGRLVFLGNHPLTAIATPDDGSNVGLTLEQPYFGMHRADWRHVEVDPGGIEFNLTISDWFALFADLGFAVERYLELQAPEGAEGDPSADVPFTTSRAWSQRYPSEQVWVVRKG